MTLYLNLIFLAAVWGASFLFMRISSPEFGPLALIFVRTSVATLVLLPFIFKDQQIKEITKRWREFALIGGLSTAVPFSLFAYTTLHVSVGDTSILNATTPFFTAIVAFYFLRERLSKTSLLGLAIGFMGVYFLSAFSVGEQGNDVAQSDSQPFIVSLLPVLSALLATFLYAVSSVYVKMKMNALTALTVATGSQLFSALILLPFAVVFWPENMPSVTAWGSAVAMGIFSTALALVIFFRLLQTEGVTKTIAVTYLIPVFGMLWGMLFLDEAITPIMLGGGALVLIGVGFTSGTFDMLFKKMRKDSTAKP